MKSTKDFRSPSGRYGSEDVRRGTKLAPAKKSGKERYKVYAEEDEDDLAFVSRKESVFDYFDDTEEDL